MKGKGNESNKEGRKLCKSKQGIRGKKCARKREGYVKKERNDGSETKTIIPFIFQDRDSHACWSHVCNEKANIVLCQRNCRGKNSLPVS